MATQAYRNWDRAGRPWDVAAPIEAIGGRLRAHGYTVYYLGSDDSSHLQADVPEDHAPFSATPWPGRQPYPYVLAMDIMPPTAGARSKLDGKPLPSLQQISAQMRADKIANHPGMRWLKYMNWEPERNYGGACWHDSWQPSYSRRSSSDRGHTHMSGRTDYVTSTASNDYDPVARVRGEDDEMLKPDERAWLKFVFDFILSGGPSSGRTVPGSKSNGGLAKLDFLVTQADEQRNRDAAILTAVKGDDDAAAIIARFDAAHAELLAQSDQHQADQLTAMQAMGDRLLAALPESGPVSREDLVAALTTVLGAVDGATPQS